MNRTRLNGPWMSAPGLVNFGRVEMAIAPSNPNRLYVSIAFTRDVGSLVGVWRTDDTWAPSPSWTELPNLPDLPPPDDETFLWYKARRDIRVTCSRQPTRWPPIPLG
jgi:hypothetical protein